MEREYLVPLSYKSQKTTTQEVKNKVSIKEKIIQVLRADGKRSREQLANVVGVSANAVKQHLANLKN
jgi:predicted ArsR family transcriptional regulator